jgi:peptide/nickel transport system permease protein
VRAAALRERQLPYVAAMTVQGFSGWRIMTRHLLPNLAPLISAQAVIAFSYAMIDLSAINFLGLGLQPPTADWGAMVASGQSAILGGDPQESLSACVCIVAVIVSVNVLGEQLARDA